MKMNLLKQSAAIVGCILALAVRAAFGQVMIGGAPNPAYSGLQLWLNAGAGVSASGGNVSVWTNQSTSIAAVGNAVVTEGQSDPTYVSSSPINGQAAIAFNGTNAGFNITNAASLMAAGTYTLFAVVQSAGPNTSSTWHYVQNILANESLDSVVYLFSVDPYQGAPYNQYPLMFSTQNGAPNFQNLYPSSYTGTLGNLAQAEWNNSTYILENNQFGTGAGQDQLLVNGVENDNGAAVAAMSPGSVWDLGWQAGNTRYFNGYISEVLVYQGALSAADQYSINTYLEDKYLTAVPEPSAVGFVVLGDLAAIVGFCRRRSQTSPHN